MNVRLLLLFATATAALTACHKAEEKKAAGPPAILITVTEAKSGSVEVVEETLGTLEAVLDPEIDAEVPGKVVRVFVGPGDAVRKGQLLALIDATESVLQNRADEAERRRIEALLAQQERLLARQDELVRQGFISRNAAEEARAQRDALRAQLAAATARGELSRRSHAKARVRAPFDGLIERQIVSPGDYVRAGDPLFRLVSNQRLRVRLPFAEAVAARLRLGQEVILTTPLLPGRVFRSRISSLRPGIAAAGRSVEAFAEIENAPQLLGGGTVNAALVLERREAVVLVPEQSVVLRPAGKVVYVIAEGKARQQVVGVGARRAGMVEITSGLSAGATIAVDGAGFLTHGASVVVKNQDRSAKPSEGRPPHGTAAATAGMRP